MRVLADNLLLRGFFAYLKNNRTNRFAKDCFWQVIESVVLYDEIIVTNVNNDVTDQLSEDLESILVLSDHEKELNLPDDWWLPKDDRLLPDFIKSCIDQQRHSAKFGTTYNPAELLV